ncbi:MAG: TMEM175 family protein [Eubacteriales bacterium]|nr:TMEM175 family protein [Eubacteriales bacterium]
MDEAPKEKENLLKRLFFNKDRLGAFMDAILAIIMTILVLELEKPSAPTLAAFASLWRAYVAYAISFLWLGSMWTALHIVWDRIERVSQRSVWISILLLFWASFLPYTTSLVQSWVAYRAAQGVYGGIVLLTTLHLYWLYLSLSRDNEASYAGSYIKMAKRNLRIDLLIKTAGLIIGEIFWPQLVAISVLIAAAFMLVGRITFRRRKAGRTCGRKSGRKAG